MSKIKLGQAGWVYCLINESMPGLVKIGATTVSPLLRARQLSAATASAIPFIVAYSRMVDDVNLVEAQMHEMLDEFRVNDGREFFAVSIYKAVSTLDLIVGGDKAEFEPATPFAELFATFDQDGPAELSPAEQKKCRELEARLAAQGTE